MCDAILHLSTRPKGTYQAIIDLAKKKLKEARINNKIIYEDTQSCFIEES